MGGKSFEALDSGEPTDISPCSVHHSLTDLEGDVIATIRNVGKHLRNVST